MKKKLFFILAAVLITVSGVFAQAPEKMSYQAVVRDSENKLVTDTEISVKFSILDDVEGTVLWTENQMVTTNANGLLIVKLGSENPLDASIFENSLLFIKTEIDLDGGIDYTISGTSQLLSVPYAFHANTASNVTETDPTWTGDANTTGTIVRDGFVGIGTTEPIQNLHVTDKAVFGNSDYGYLALGFDFVNHDLGLIDYWTDVLIAGKPQAEDADLYQYGGVPGTSEGIIIHNHNVGIGEANPSTKLHVAGDIMATGKIRPNYYTNNGVPICYGMVAGNGTLTHGTSNITSVVWEEGSKRYKIDMPGYFSLYKHVWVVTPYTSQYPLTATAFDLGTSLYVKIWNTLTGEAQQARFSFIVFDSTF